MYASNSPKRLQNAYVADYLKEEVAAEGLVGNLPVFSGFLNMAALSDTQPVNFSTLARDQRGSSRYPASIGRLPRKATKGLR